MKVFVGSYLAAITGKTEIDIACPEEATLSDFFNQHLFKTYPELKLRIADENGNIRRHVAVFVGDTHIRFLEQAQTRISPEDEIYILPAVSGG